MIEETIEDIPERLHLGETSASPVYRSYEELSEEIEYSDNSFVSSLIGDYLECNEEDEDETLKELGSQLFGKGFDYTIEFKLFIEQYVLQDVE